MRAIGYTRVSTAGQATDGVSLDAQRNRIEAWCVANECSLAKIHVDAGISGKRTTNRPALQEALASVCKRPAGTLIVYSLSRLARSTKDAIVIAEQLDKAGADLVSLSERIDTTNAAGKMLFRMLAVFAEFERDLVSERTIAAMATKRTNGERVGSIPYGFDLNDDRRTLVENLKEQAIIEDIRSMRKGGSTLKKIAADLSEMGILTKTGLTTWSHQAVSRILKRHP